MAIKTEQEYLEWKKTLEKKPSIRKPKQDTERNKPVICESCQ